MSRLSFFLAGTLLGFQCASAAMAAPMASEQPPKPSAEAVIDTSAPLGDSLTLLPVVFGKQAVGVTQFGTFPSIAVLHEGRVKPLESLARDQMLQWSGRSGYPGRSALDVFAEILFAPEKTGNYKIFLIDNPEVAEALHITPEKHRRYAYRELEPALHRLQTLASRADSVKAEKRNLVEKEFLRTFTNVITYLNLTRAMAFARPANALNIQLPETRKILDLNVGQTTPPSFWQLMERAPILARVLETVGARPDSSRTPVEEEIVRLSRSMFLESQTVQPSLFCILPDPEHLENWLSPAEIIADPGRLQKLHNEIAYLAAMTEAYRGGDANGFSRQAGLLRQSVDQRAYAQMSKTRFSLEIFYDHADPLYLAIIGYGIALLLCLLFFLVRKRWLYNASSGVAFLSLAVHIGGIVSRILIMHRPPVTSLYETFPFVSAVSISVALFLERRTRQGVGLLAAGLLGVVLLSIANRYAADGDTLQMLVAVLNSNFWLSTHVICITTGYAACLLAGAIGHIYLVRAAVQGKSTASLKEVDRMVFGTLCFGLLFSFIGTVLGGIWADQSWGRFWGWDPKENGALLIVLWCAILLHARFFGIIRDFGMAMGSVFGAIIVSLAWLGVNLLNVGLHSYGFTTGAAVKLFSYIGCELLFLLIVGIVIARQPKRVRTPPVAGHGAATIAKP